MDLYRVHGREAYWEVGRMGRTCTVCRHPERDALDGVLVANHAAFRELAALYSLSPSALRRHKLEHLPTALVRAAEAEQTTRGESLLDQVRRLQARSTTILDKAEHTGDLRATLAALRELRGVLDLFGRLAIKSSDVVEVVVVERFVQNVFEILHEFVPEERLDTAVAKLHEAIESEAALADQELVTTLTDSGR